MGDDLAHMGAATLVKSLPERKRSNGMPASGMPPPYPGLSRPASESARSIVGFQLSWLAIAGTFPRLSWRLGRWGWVGASDGMIHANAKTILAVCAVLVLAGCAETDRLLFQSFAGEAPGEPLPATAKATKKPVPKPRSGAPELGATRYRFEPVIMPRESGSSVNRTVSDLGERFAELERDIADRDSELQQRRAALSAKNEDFSVADAALNRKHDAAHWRQARIQLDLVYLEIDRMNALASEIDTDRRSLTQIIASARTAGRLAGLSAAARDQLVAVGRKAGDLRVLLARMQSEIRSDIDTQNTYANTQRDQLVQLASRIDLGPDQTAERRPAQPAIAKSPANPETAVAATPPGTVARQPRRPLVTIRFNRPRVAYAAPLYRAIRLAVEKRPDVAFDVVGIAPTRGGGIDAESRKRLDGVLATLSAMGVPARRIRASAIESPTATTDEVRIFVR